MTWQDLPEGLVDSFRKEAFSLNGQGIIIVQLDGKGFRVTSGGNFFAKLYDRIQDLLNNQTKADVLILFGRTKDGEKLSPQVQVRLFGV
jgi:hypothetical protein